MDLLGIHHKIPDGTCDPYVGCLLHSATCSPCQFKCFPPIASLVLSKLRSALLISAHGVAAGSAKAAFHKLLKHDLCAAAST